MDRVIEELLKDPRRPFTEIAKEVGVSDTAVRKRFRRLVSKGVIKPALLVNPKEFDLRFAQIRVMKDVDSVAERFKNCPRVLLMARLETTGELVIWFTAENDETMKCGLERHFPGAIVDLHAEVVSPKFVQIGPKPEVPKNRSPCEEFCIECGFLNRCSGCPATVHFKASSRKPGSM